MRNAEDSVKAWAGDKNPVIAQMFCHRSIRKYKSRRPSARMVELIVRAGQAASYAAQLYSLVLTTDRRKHPFKAPLLFTVCVDLHKMELIMKQRDWCWVSNDLFSLLLAIQDACYLTQNMILAAESLGLGACLLGETPYRAQALARELSLPPRVFPLVQLAMGYPAESSPARPRYPLEFVLFRNKYPKLSERMIKEAMQTMDRGFLSQGYYRKAKLIIPLGAGRKETFNFNNYSWTEHQSRKWGQWHADSGPLWEQFYLRGFDLGKPSGRGRRRRAATNRR